MVDDDMKKDGESSKLHWLGGALSGGSTVPLSLATGGFEAAKEGVFGAVVGGLIGLNGLFDDDEEA